MSDSPQDAVAAKAPLHARITGWGVAILVVGLVGAALIYVFAADERPDPAAAIENDRLYEYNIERIGGMAAVYTARFNRWLGGLWHGKPLAYTVAALATAFALVLFWVARMVYIRSPRAADPGGGATNR